MTHPELVAMLPVETEAVERLHYGEMPLRLLLEALAISTGGRVLRLDETWNKARPPGRWSSRLRRARASPEKLTVGGEGSTSERPLYLEYVIRDTGS
jgi:hypothetical protein